MAEILANQGFWPCFLGEKLQMKKNKDLLKQIGSMGIFGTIGLVRKHLSQGSGLIALVRGTVGALFLGLVSLATGRKIDRAGIKQNLGLLIVSGVLLGANWACLFEAYNHTSISVATMCYYMAPVIVILVSTFIYKERMTKIQYVLTLVALGGMLLVSGVFQEGGADLTGVVFGLVAACMYATIVLLNRRIKNIAPMDRTMMQLAVSAVAMLPYVLWVEKLPSILPTGKEFVLLLVAGVLHTGVAYLMYFGSIPNLKAHTVAILSYIDPVVAVLVSVLVQREPMTLMSGIGVVLVIGATAKLSMSK